MLIKKRISQNLLTFSSLIHQRTYYKGSLRYMHQSNLPNNFPDLETYIKFIKQNTKITDQIEQKRLKHIYKSLKQDQIHWKELCPNKMSVIVNENGIQKQVPIIYFASGVSTCGEPIQQRISELSQSQFAFTILYKDIELFHVKDLPSNWIYDKPPSSYKKCFDQ